MRGVVHTVDLNVDLGELPDEPPALYELATVVNVACGGHAGDGATMRAAVRAARAAGARVAAHPSYADREGFGRRAAFAPATAAADAVLAQCRDLAVIAAEEGVAIALAKPHGALYHDAARDPELAAATVDAVIAALGGVTLVGPPTGALVAAARTRGLAYAREGFADRGYDTSGELLPRGAPGALLDDPATAARQALALARRGDLETLCVHGDTPGAVAIARAVRAALEEAGWLRPRG